MYTKEQIEATWCACLLEGEGWIVCKRAPRKNGRGVWSLCNIIKIEINSSDFAYIKRVELFHPNPQRKLLLKKPRLTEKGTMTKPQLRYTLNGKEVYKFIKKIFPFMTPNTPRFQVAEKIINHYEL